MAEARTYEGGCHCGAVRWRATAAIDRVISCNCSICQRTGALLAFVPVDAFTLLSGEGALTDYGFGPKRIHHLFCGRCGIRSFARATDPAGREVVALNVRCLEGVEPEAFAVHRFDGRSRPIPGAPAT